MRKLYGMCPQDGRWGNAFESRMHTPARKSVDAGFAWRAIEMVGLKTRCAKPTAIYQMCLWEAECEQESN